MGLEEWQDELWRNMSIIAVEVRGTYISFFSFFVDLYIFFSFSLSLSSRGKEFVYRKAHEHYCYYYCVQVDLFFRF